MTRAADSARRLSPDDYLALPLRAHELLRDVPIYDVTVVDLLGGGVGRRIADIRRLEAQSPPSVIVRALFGLRLALGRLFGWDRSALRPEESLRSRLSEKDRRDSEVAPGSHFGAFLVVYQFAEEALAETRNSTVHGWVCTALAPRGSGYRLYMAVYVRPVSWLTRPYLLLIEPFRRFLVYPAMLRRIRRAWIAAYGAAA
ncbi:MAG TPA: DUF2867 domain-containing protein [Thermoanaerobaculia bacterium]